MGRPVPQPMSRMRALPGSSLQNVLIHVLMGLLLGGEWVYRKAVLKL